MFKKSFIVFIILLLWTTPCLAGQSALTPGPFVAVAVHIDTAGKNILGSDLLEAGINRLIQTKFSLVMMDGMVLSGSSVLRDLKKSGITDFTTAEPSKLKSYGRENELSYILLFTLHPLDISADIKAFDVDKGDYVIGKKITQPKEAESGSGLMDTMLSKFSHLIDSEIDDILKTISKS